MLGCEQACTGTGRANQWVGTRESAVGSIPSESSQITEWPEPLMLDTDGLRAILDSEPDLCFQFKIMLLQLLFSSSFYSFLNLEGLHRRTEILFTEVGITLFFSAFLRDFIQQPQLTFT